MSAPYILARAAVVGQGTDMQEHMGTLKRYASLCPRIVEFGVYDCTSTWGLLAGLPKWMRSYDIARRTEVDEVERITPGVVDFKFVLANTLEVEIEYTDLLFIDSYHSYDQLTKEFELHANKVNRFILLHDTVTFGEVDQDEKRPALQQAIDEFLRRGGWRVREHFAYGHGLTALERT